MATLKPYTGARKSLVLAFDFGPTFSSVAFAVLDPGKVPCVRYVGRFPGQDDGDLKMPSVICYAKDGEYLAAGAEAKHRASIPNQELGDAELLSLERLKLHICPLSLRPEGLNLPALSPGRCIVAIVADFLAYLFKCAQQYICDSSADGSTLWASFQDRIEIIVSHPNGWEGAPLDTMRDAAILGGIMTDTPVGRARLHFITEGEAILRYFMNSGVRPTENQDGSGVIVVNAGNDAVDVAAYKLLASDPLDVEETAPPISILQGLSQVNVDFYKYLQERLRGSVYDSEDDINAMLQGFERSIKTTFENPAARYAIKFGRLRDTDVSVGIKNGSLVVEGADIVKLFKPFIDVIVAAIRDQRRAAATPVNVVLLAGCASSVPWLHVNLRNALETDGVVVYRPGGHPDKHVAEGAVAYFLERFTTTIVARMTWGIQGGIPYRADNPDHHKRRDKVQKDALGEERLYNVFRTFVYEGTRFAEGEVLRFNFIKRSNVRKDLNRISHPILCYRGVHPIPYWMDEDPDSYWPLYTVRANVSGIYKFKEVGMKGVYYMINYDVVLTATLTGFRAQIAWTHNGVEKRSDAEMIYENA